MAEVTLIGPLRLMEKGTTIAAAVGVEHLQERFEILSQFLRSSTPQLLVLGAPSDPSAEQARTRLSDALPGWRMVRLDESGGKQSMEGAVADVGVVITRATAPWRAEEAELVSRFGRRAFKWHVLLTHTQGLDEEDLEEASQFVRAASRRLLEGNGVTDQVWADPHTCACTLAVSDPIPARPPAILRQLQESLVELGRHAATQCQEMQLQFRQLHEAIRTAEKAHTTGARSVHTLQQQTERDLTGLQGAVLANFNAQMHRAEAELIDWVRDVPLEDFTHTFEEELESRLRMVLETVGHEADQRFTGLTQNVTSRLAEIGGLDGTVALVLDEPILIDLSRPIALRAGSKTAGSDLGAGLLRSILSGAGVWALVAQTALATLALPVAIAVGAVFMAQNHKQEQRRLRAELERSLREGWRNSSLSGATDLKQIVAVATEQVSADLARLFADTTCHLQKHYAASEEREQLRASEQRLAELRQHQHQLSRLAERVEREMERQELLLQIGHLNGSRD